MRVFVCEYVTGGGMCGQAPAPSLRREGDLMLAALVKDLAEVPGIEVVSTRDSRLPPADLPARVEVVEQAEAVWATWRRIVLQVDALWAIAPESDGAMERLSRLALDQGRTLLGSDAGAVRLTASKLRTADLLAAHGLPVVSTRPADDVPAAAHGWVVKPDDGAGCEDTRLFRDEIELRDWLNRPGGACAYVVQPYVSGQALSLSVLCSNGAARVLSCNTQCVAVVNGRFRYLGGVVGGAVDRHEVLDRVAARVAAAIPGLWGYVGIDLIDTADGPTVLEVNPRLTTSYVGLHRALGVNPAALVLDLLHGRAPGDMRFPMSVPVEVCIGGGDG